MSGKVHATFRIRIFAASFGAKRTNTKSKYFDIFNFRACTVNTNRGWRPRGLTEFPVLSRITSETSFVSIFDMPLPVLSSRRHSPYFCTNYRLAALSEEYRVNCLFCSTRTFFCSKISFFQQPIIVKDFPTVFLLSNRIRRSLRETRRISFDFSSARNYIVRRKSIAETSFREIRTRVSKRVTLRNGLANFKTHPKVKWGKNLATRALDLGHFSRRSGSARVS